ncbi:MAG: type II 3-dehydroquinate dehydratase [Chitinophagales bacterium]|nr:type II 3-dehydroquinate dehydratase [Chitinophagales bacterium]
MLRIAIINGPNLNLLGTREVDIYGGKSFDEFLTSLRQKYPDISFSYYQSNVEGELINRLQECNGTVDGIVFNGAGYTHTSVSIADAIAAISTPVLEVHISNIHAREEYRHHSLTSSKCVGSITGLGLIGYELAVNYFIETSAAKTS